MAEEKKLGRDAYRMGACSDSPEGSPELFIYSVPLWALEKGQKVSAGKGIYDID